MTAVTENIRNAPLPSLLEILQDRQARKIDLVVPAAKLRFVEGELVLTNLDQIVEDDGVTDPNGTYQPTATFDDHLAERLDIHPSYLRRLRHGKTHAKTAKLIAGPRLDLFDINANGLLHGRKPKLSTLGQQRVRAGIGWADLDDFDFVHRGTPADSRSFLARLFRSDESGRGIARGLLSNRYLRMDDLDGLMAMLTGIQDAGVDPSTLKIYGDLTETRMYVHVQAPEIATWAPELLDGYRSPFDTGIEGTKRQAHGYSMAERIAIGQKLIEERGWSGWNENLRGDGSHKIYEKGSEPIIHAGFKMMNSELGNGRWQIVPEFTVLACSNGLTMTKEVFAKTHLGSKLDDGHIEWSLETQGKELAWVTSQTKDLVKLALSQDYLEERVFALGEKAGKVVADPEKAIEVLAQRLKYTKDEQDGILRYFLMGGQATAGGVMNAVTAFSQTLDADRAFDLDNTAVQALEMAASLR